MYCEMATATGILATLESALRKLRYKESADRKDQEQKLFGLKVVDLKSMCKELHVKVNNAIKGKLAPPVSVVDGGCLQTQRIAIWQDHQC